jgi:hypothetical protein
MNTFRTTILATLTFTFIVAFSDCALIKGIESASPGKNYMADTAVFVIFNSSTQINLSSEELSKIDSILQQCTNKIGSHLSQYKRQYVPSINDKGEKVVWVNCFCSKWDRNWKKELIRVEDGGSCYFNVTINLVTGKYDDLRVNGVG